MPIAKYHTVQCGAETSSHVWLLDSEEANSWCVDIATRLDAIHTYTAAGP